jgi:hypothetical protein
MQPGGGRRRMLQGRPELGLAYPAECHLALKEI